MIPYRVWDGRHFVAERGREPGIRTVYLADYIPHALIAVVVVGIGLLAAVVR